MGPRGRKLQFLYNLAPSDRNCNPKIDNLGPRRQFGERAETAVHRRFGARWPNATASRPFGGPGGRNCSSSTIWGFGLPNSHGTVAISSTGRLELQNCHGTIGISSTGRSEPQNCHGTIAFSSTGRSEPQNCYGTIAFSCTGRSEPQNCHGTIAFSSTAGVGGPRLPRLRGEAAERHRRAVAYLARIR